MLVFIVFFKTLKSSSFLHFYGFHYILIDEEIVERKLIFQTGAYTGIFPGGCLSSFSFEGRGGGGFATNMPEPPKNSKILLIQGGREQTRPPPDYYLITVFYTSIYSNSFCPNLT